MFHNACLCVGEIVGNIGEVGERELVLVVSQVRQRMRRDTDDNWFGT